MRGAPRVSWRLRRPRASIKIVQPVPAPEPESPAAALSRVATELAGRPVVVAAGDHLPARCAGTVTRQGNRHTIYLQPAILAGEQGPEELERVFAHELAHVIYGHVPERTFASPAQHAAALQAYWAQLARRGLDPAGQSAAHAASKTEIEANLLAEVLKIRIVASYGAYFFETILQGKDHGKAFQEIG